LGAADGSRYFDSFVGTAIAHGTAQGIIAEASGGEFKDGFKIGFAISLASSAYSKVSKDYNKTGKAHLFQEGKADTGFELNNDELKAIADRKMDIPLPSDQSTFMKTIAKGPFVDAASEFHDGFHDIPGIPSDQLTLIATMPPSYALTVMAYSQPYTGIHIIGRNNRKYKEDNE